MAKHVIYQQEMFLAPAYNPLGLFEFGKKGWLLRSVMRAEGSYCFRLERPAAPELQVPHGFELKRAKYLRGDVSFMSDEGWALATIIYLAADKEYAFYFQRPL